ncbi:hypothetical protein V7087_13495 [Neobacillus niacini]|uniref:hypothetical protein n=1 Tax=Neobacillus niacini TaxID=86668 RepID=UPI002FFFE283
MNVLIQISYTTNDNSVFQKGSFPLKGRKPERVALEFWKWIKSDHPFDCKIEKIMCDGDDVTQLIKDLEKAAYE